MAILRPGSVPIPVSGVPDQPDWLYRHQGFRNPLLPETNVYRLIDEASATLQPIQKGWGRDGVMMPPKFRGCIGVYQQSKWKREILFYELLAIHEIGHETYEDFHLSVFTPTT